MPEELQTGEGIEASHQVVEDDAEAAVEALVEEVNRERFEDIEEPEEDEGQQPGDGMGGNGDHGDQHPGHLINDHAARVWFIDDLSRGASGFADPYIILVVIMVVAQFLSQKLTMPSTQQNKMMIYLMPLFMGYIFHTFAAGLVLYWICFSVFSLLDYVLFKRKKNSQVMTA